MAAATKAVWNGPVRRDLQRLIRRTRPDIAHFENTFPLVSPAAYYACHAEGVPVVQTLHNFRLLCSSGLLYRNGQVCEDCVGKRALWPGVVHGCYRGSRVGSAVVAAMITTHRVIGTWRNEVDAYITLNDFARAKYAAAGLAAEQLHVSPNFLAADPGPGRGDGGVGHAGTFRLMA